MPELIPAAPGTPEWLAARRTGVTATDSVTILGLSSWSSPYSLFWQKMGQVPETPDNDRFRLGRYLQDYARDRWHEEAGMPTARNAAVMEAAVSETVAGAVEQVAAPKMITPDTFVWNDGGE